MPNREFMEQRQIDNARAWEKAKKSLQRQAQVVLVIGAIIAGLLWYLYFLVATTPITLTPAEQQTLKERAAKQ